MPKPVAPEDVVTHSLHGIERRDPWHWLKDREDPRTIPHLEAENAWTAEQTAHQEALRKTLYDEIIGRIQQTDETVPARRGAWWYLTREEEGRQYPLYARRAGGPDGEETVYLDLNALAEGQDYLRVGAVALSPDQRRVAYSVDTDGGERFTVFVRDLETLQDQPTGITNASGRICWIDDHHLLYTTLDEAWRPDKVWRHRLDAGVDDVLVHHETDAATFAGVSRSRSGAFVMLSLSSNKTSQALVLPTDTPTADFVALSPRVQDVEVSADHAGGHLYIRSNKEGADDFALWRVPASTPTAAWEEVLPHRPGTVLTGITGFADHLVLIERVDGLLRPAVLDIQTGTHRQVAAEHDVFSWGLGANLDWHQPHVRLTYDTLTTAERTYDVDLATLGLTLRREDPVLGDYDASAYAQERVWATTEDGTRVPVSLVYRVDQRREGGNPTLVYGYGSYGHTVDPYFSYARVSMLDRGMVWAIAHVRGSGTFGRRWWNDGKLAKKTHTFDDFNACAQHLVDTGIAAAGQVGCMGGSAGGLLVGASINRAPAGLYAAAVAHVPFVDVLSTMEDETLPLTVIEWEEWGNPKVAEEYDWIAAYSPYDCVVDRDYPRMLVTAGLNDPRVGYWEPAKWVARLRSHDVDVLLKTQMGAGHAGVSGRYSRIEETAFEFAWLLEALGCA